MPAFAFPSSASGSGTSTPCYSDNGYPGSGMSLPHTPLPGTPLALEKYWPLMITPTPSHNTPFSFDFPTQQPQSTACLPATTTDDGSVASPGSTGSAGTLTGLEDAHARAGRQGKRLASTWSMESSVVDDDDGLEWDDREEGILLSFLDNPLHPLATPYPPGTLPPSSALDDITSQIIRFHSPPTPIGASYLNLSELVAGGGGSPAAGQDKPRSALGISTSVSAPSLPSSAARRHALGGGGGSKHRRTHSASGIPWVHSWGATRRKLYEIARREALGSNREDRFKGRVISPPMATANTIAKEEAVFDRTMVSAECTSTPLCVPRSTSAGPISSTISATRNAQDEGEEVTETPSGRIMKRPGGGIMMQRHGSETMLEFPALVGSSCGIPAREDEHERAQALEARETSRGIGQALRLSSSLQRSTKGPTSEVVNPAHPANGRPRKASLLQRGQSFTADDFNNCLTISSDSGAASDGDDEPEVEFTQFVDQDCVTPSAVWDTQIPTLATHHVGSLTSARNGRQQDLFDDMFGQQQQLGMLSPSSSSISGSEACHETSDDTEMIPATPDQAFALPCILLTKTSPTPGIHARNGSGSSDLEMVSAPSAPAGPKGTCGLGTPLNLSPPGSPLARPQQQQQQQQQQQVISSLVLDLERTPRPVITPSVARPGLIRARSSAAAYATPSAFSQFMSNAPLAPAHPVGGNLSDMPPVSSLMGADASPLPRGPAALGLFLPTAKRQKISYTNPQLTIPLAPFGMGDDNGLASPFDEKKMF
ncbi:hypothetical protein QFC22_005215 [Naganishia vaughanmartiniae]|uniref:Uncharacterized protein n=1 Tax=Naganishia vaughanmartiniae TaxID=1424756 RepID=A0ACC2WY98_9TREE|nr:hypothetical protein QFC22_005215 [Naganishia vaughanmartiniae]